MTPLNANDPSGSDDAVEAPDIWSPPAAPLPMPRQSLESPRSVRDWLIFRTPSPRRG